MNADLLGLCSIRKWIEKWRNQGVDARKKDMDIRGDVRAKPVCEEGEEGKEIKLQEDTNVSNARIERLNPSLLLGQTKHCDKDLHV